MTYLSVVAGCFNEEENVTELYERISGSSRRMCRNCDFELILIDNASTDDTVAC